MRRTADRLGIATSALAVLGLFLRVTLRDRVPVLATVFYATPLPVVSALLALAGVAFFAASRRRVAATLAASAALAGAAAFRAGWHPARETATPARDAMRVVQWNVSHRGDATWTRSQAATFDADVIALVETGKLSGGAVRAWQWPAVLATDGMLVLAKDSVEDRGAIDLGPHARARHVVATSGGRVVPIVIVDVESNPLVPRHDALSRVLRAAAGIEGPLLVLGDFNTPPESAWFDAFRGSFVNAFEAAGEGWAPTWPAKRAFPVLHLDQVWVRGIAVKRTKHGWVAGFDHRPVLVDLE